MKNTKEIKLNKFLRKNKSLALIFSILFTVGMVYATTTITDSGTSNFGSDIELGGNNLNATNITATYFMGDGSLLTGVSGNASWNQSWATTLFAPINYGDDWNKTYADTLYLTSESDPTWNANYTIFTGLIDNASYLSTYNATYDAYATNVSTNWSTNTFNIWDSRWSQGNSSWNQSWATTLYAPITVIDTSASVNCSTDGVFLGNGSCWSASAFFDDTTANPFDQSLNTTDEASFTDIVIEDKIKHQGDTHTNIEFKEDWIGFNAGGYSNLFYINASTYPYRRMVFNEGGISLDFRWESNDDVNALFFNGTSGKLGLGTNMPSQDLDVRGDGNFSGTIYINNATDVSSLGNASWNQSWATTLYAPISVIDTSATVNCSDGQVFLGNGTCWDTSVFFDDTDTIGLGNYDNIAMTNTSNTFTAGQSLTGENITAIDCIIFDSGGKICSGS